MHTPNDYRVSPNFSYQQGYQQVNLLIIKQLTI